MKKNNVTFIRSHENSYTIRISYKTACEEWLHNHTLITTEVLLNTICVLNCKNRLLTLGTHTPSGLHLQYLIFNKLAVDIMVTNIYFQCFTGSRWVGWRDDSNPGQISNPIEIIFAFDQIRNFSAMHIHTSNMFSNDIQVRGIFMEYCIIIWDIHSYLKYS